jgi:hypothetical protein
MNLFLIDTISKNACMDSGEDILDYLDLCRDCGEIPIPSYRTFRDINHTYCKKCKDFL